LTYKYEYVHQILDKNRHIKAQSLPLTHPHPHTHTIILKYRMWRNYLWLYLHIPCTNIIYRWTNIEGNFLNRDQGIIGDKLYVKQIWKIIYNSLPINRYLLIYALAQNVKRNKSQIIEKLKREY